MPNYPKDQQLKPVTFSDFSPGIVQRTGVLGATQYSPAKLGSAQDTNTYRCIALPGGGLGPLPKRTTDHKFTDLSGASIGAGVTAHITGFFVFGPVIRDGLTLGTFPPLPAIPYEAHIAFEYVTGGVQVHKWKRYPYFDNTLSAGDIVSANLGAVNNIYGPTYFTSLRMYPGGTLEGYPVVVGSWMPAESVLTPPSGVSYAKVNPDPSAPGAVGSADLFASSGEGGPVLGHQSRTLLLRRELRNHNEAVLPLNENILYTLPNDIALDSEAVFGQEFPVGYGAWGSLSSSDLLLIKHYGGAYLVQGDLNTPIVRRFPGVISTGGVETVGSSSSMGFIYGVNNDGVYAWQGGDGSTNISPQMEPGFWQASSLSSVQNYRGTFMGWGDWVLCPNNYLYDIPTQSWWKIEDQSSKTYYIWMKNPVANAAIGAVTTATNSDNIFASVFDRALPALSYSWQSQPFSPDDRRRVRTRAVTITAQGSGTVTVTIVPTDSGESAPIQPDPFTINTAGATRQMANSQTAGTEFVLRIVSNGGSNPAPIVHEVSIDFEALSQPTMAS